MTFLKELFQKTRVPFGILLKATGLSWSRYNNWQKRFGQLTTIGFELEKPADICLIIYNNTGQQIKEYNMFSLQAGYHSIIWDGLDNSKMQAASGVYFYK